MICLETEPETGRRNVTENTVSATWASRARKWVSGPPGPETSFVPSRVATFEHEIKTWSRLGKSGDGDIFFFYATPLSVAEARLLSELADAMTAYRYIICVCECEFSQSLGVLLHVRPCILFSLMSGRGIGWKRYTWHKLKIPGDRLDARRSFSVP